MTSRELDLLFQADRDVQLDRLAPAALICSVLANIHRDEDKRPEPYRPADFMPGAKSERDELIEWAEAVASGKTFAEEPNPDDQQRFRREMQETFNLQ
jgi:hypothetical protein